MIRQKPQAKTSPPVRAREVKVPPLVRLQWRKMLRLMVVYPDDLVLDAQKGRCCISSCGERPRLGFAARALRRRSFVTRASW